MEKIDAATANIITGDISAGSGLAKSCLDQSGSSRCCGIALSNMAGLTLVNPRSYISSGKAAKNFPYRIRHGECGLFHFEKTSMMPRGACGILSYLIEGRANNFLLIFFHVPFEKTVTSCNSFDVHIMECGPGGIPRYDRGEEVTNGLYNHCYNKCQPTKAHSQVGVIQKDLWGSYAKVYGQMTNGGKAQIDITLTSTKTVEYDHQYYH